MIRFDPTTHAPRARSAARRKHFRAKRVILLLLGVVLLSLADLVLTLFHLKNFGMAEANPIAVSVISITRSSWGLSLYKLLTVGICIGLLYRVRHYLVAEIGAWVAISVLCGVSFVWHFYSDAMDEIVLQQHDPEQKLEHMLSLR